MKGRVKNSTELVDVIALNDRNGNVAEYVETRDRYRSFTPEEIEIIDEEFTVEGWLCCDLDRKPTLFSQKPERASFKSGFRCWLNGGPRIFLPKSLFSPLKFEDEPRKVRLTLTCI